MKDCAEKSLQGWAESEKLQLLKRLARVSLQMSLRSLVPVCSEGAGGVDGEAAAKEDEAQDCCPRD